MHFTSPTTNANCSVSTSTSPGVVTVPAVLKKFSCTFPGCNKGYSRSEHLQRHALNHEDGGSTCERCSAHFKRPDLFELHLKRHKERDDKADGEGLGNLRTRKKLRRDAKENIVVSKKAVAAPTTMATANVTQPQALSTNSDQIKREERTKTRNTGPTLSDRIQAVCYMHQPQSPCNIPPILTSGLSFDASVYPTSGGNGSLPSSEYVNSDEKNDTSWFSCQLFRDPVLDISNDASEPDSGSEQQNSHGGPESFQYILPTIESQNWTMTKWWPNYMTPITPGCSTYDEALSCPPQGYHLIGKGFLL
ncbi:hypothetical protein F5884DRAFT_808950 [Xylogone sp. PMI_703]|nr:hypothetical protein F5884DRAFT_808950 [Xylogone sp. PMI_703]